MCRVALLFLGIIPVLASGEDLITEPDRGAKESPDANPPGAYCGILSVYRAARALGSDLQFADLLKAEYISSRQGSSLDDLLRAASENGLHAESVGRMTCAMLEYIQCPVILHVKRDLVTSEDYDHWILFAGIEPGKARIYDGVGTVELVDWADLASRWDGVAILIARSPMSTMTLGLVVAAQFVSCVGAITAAIALLLCMYNWSLKRRGTFSPARWHGCIAEGAIVTLLAAILGIGFRLLNGGGFLSYSPAVAAIQDKHLGGFLPKVDVDTVPGLLHQADVTVVDARLPADYEAGHLEGAMNIPPDSSPEQCLKIIEKVPRSDRIFIYCHSNGCPYSAIVARKLLALGYSHILYFRDGWVVWEEYQKSHPGS